MRYPNLKEERKLWKKGLKYVVCLDEVGRGCVAGPVVAAAAMIKNPKSQIPNPKQPPNPKFQIQNLKINDSKKLSPKKREEFYRILTKHPGIKWAMGRVSEKVIDKINILEATKLAMIKAVQNLENKINRGKNSSLSCTYVRVHKKNLIDFLILDGNFKLNFNSDGRIRIPERSPKGGARLRYSDAMPQKSIVKADEKVFSCAAASIIAKVTRDRIMRKYHQKYPQYGFDKHKGYATKYHRKMLKKYGPCLLHRLSFAPLKNMVKLANKT